MNKTRYGYNPYQSLVIKAKKHHKLMMEKYQDKTDEAIKNTSIIFAGNVSSEEHGLKPKVVLSALDSVGAAFKFSEGKTAILNFASYTSPGGAFIYGAKAQEECLCHQSNLYEVLSAFKSTFYKENRKRLNDDLYCNTALYSPSVIFFDNNNNEKEFDVITCAAPNLSAYVYHCEEVQTLPDWDFLNEVIDSRVNFIKKIAEDNNVDTIILGAFGCGVFGCDPEFMALAFKNAFKDTTIKKVVYAILGEASQNYQVFSAVINSDNC